MKKHKQRITDLSELPQLITFDQLNEDKPVQKEDNEQEIISAYMKEAKKYYPTKEAVPF